MALELTEWQAARAAQGDCAQRNCAREGARGEIALKDFARAENTHRDFAHREIARGEIARGEETGGRDAYAGQHQAKLLRSMEHARHAKTKSMAGSMAIVPVMVLGYAAKYVLSTFKV